MAEPTLAVARMLLPWHLHHLGNDSRGQPASPSVVRHMPKYVSMDILFTDPHVLEVLESTGVLVRVVRKGAGGGAAASCGGDDIILRDAVPPSSHPSRLLILHPGNPGVVHLYRRFCLHLAQAMPDLAVLVVGYPGHSLECHEDRARVYGLQEQVELAEEFVGRLLVHRRRAAARLGPVGTSVPEGALYRRGVYSAGHSCGAFLSLHVLARFKADIRLSFQMAPTIFHIAKSPNGKDVVKRLLFSPLGTWSAATLISRPFAALVPRSAQRAIVKAVQSGLDDDSADVVVRMLHPSVVRNVLSLARAEFQQIATLDEPLALELHNQLVFYFAPGDGWVPPADIEHLRTTLPRPAGFVIEEPGRTSHAWCLDGPQWAAAMVDRFIREDYTTEARSP